MVVQAETSLEMLLDVVITVLATNFRDTKETESDNDTSGSKDVCTDLLKRE